MKNLLKTITKEKRVNKVQKLIKYFSNMQEEAYKKAEYLGYSETEYYFQPTCFWSNLNEDETEILLTFKLEIFEK